MAGIPPVALLLGAAAAFMLLGGKKGEPKSDSLPSLDRDGDGKPSGGVPEIPKAKTQDELQKELDEQAEATLKEVRDGLQWKLMPAGYDIPKGMAHNEIWVSEDCEAAAIGRDWKPIQHLGGKLHTPATGWKEYFDGVNPLEDVGANKGTSAVTWYTNEVFKESTALVECSGEIPDPKAFDNNEDLGNAWTDFRNSYPAFSAIHTEVYDHHVGHEMLAAWFQNNPDDWMGYQIGRTAKWVAGKYPQEDVTEQTDLAYAAFTDLYGDLWEDDPPPLLDPDNSDHEMWIELWLDLNQAIKDL